MRLISTYTKKQETKKKNVFCFFVIVKKT